jgi:hypothetical protein
MTQGQGHTRGEVKTDEEKRTEKKRKRAEADVRHKSLYAWKTWQEQLIGNIRKVQQTIVSSASLSVS